WFAAFVLGGTLAALAAATAWFLMSPKHTAMAQIRVLSKQTRMLPDPHEGREDFKTFIKTVSSQIKRPRVIREALKQDKVVPLKLSDQESDAAAFIDEAMKVEFPENSEILTVSLATNDPNVSVTLLKAVLDSFKKLIVDEDETQRRVRVADLDK